MEIMQSQTHPSPMLLSSESASMQSQAKQWCVINRNFSLKVSLIKQQYQSKIQGSIFFNDGTQLSLPNEAWNLIYHHKRLQKNSITFIYNFDSCTTLIVSKWVMTKQSVSKIKEKFFKRKKQMIEVAKYLVQSCCKFGFLPFSNKIYFKQAAESCILKKRMFSILYPACVQKIPQNKSEVCITAPLEKLNPDEQFSICVSPIEIVDIQKQMSKDKDFLKKLPQELEAGIKSLKSHLQSKEQSTIVQGGFFTIQKLLCRLQKKKLQSENPDSIIQKLNLSQTYDRPKELSENQKIDILVRKTLKEGRKSAQENDLKITKELTIVKQIKDRQHLVKYFLRKDEQTQFQANLWNMRRQRKKDRQSIITNDTYMSAEKIDFFLRKQVFMEFHSHTLADIIIKKQCQSIQETMHTCLQLLEAVKILHNNHVIHRDLKPENILVDFVSNRTKSIIKIIDFAEAAIYTEANRKFQRDLIPKILIEKIFQNHQPKLYGSTLPYSPPECAQKGGKEKRTSEGINSSKIDSWSVGMILSEISHRKKQINFSKPFAEDIMKIVKDTGLELHYSRIKGRGFCILSELINFLGQRIVIQQQSKRIQVSEIYNCFALLDQSFKAWIQQINGAKVRREQKSAMAVE